MSVQVVAELSINHGGDVDVAMEMIRAAKDSGCDGVKLQTYRAEDFLPAGHEDFGMFKRAEIWPHLGLLVRYAHDVGLTIGTTPTSIEGVAEAVEAGVDFLKNGSDFLLRHDLIEAMLGTGLPVWVSTGMAYDQEILMLPKGVNLMLCTSLYPCPDEDVNLTRCGDYFFRGFSDHTAHGSVAAVLAVGAGVEMIERHFCLGDGPDVEWSLEPEEMTDYVADIRRAETMLGESVYPSPAELVNRERWRVTTERLRT